MTSTRQNAFYIMTFTPLWGDVIGHLSQAHGFEPALYVGLPLPAEPDSKLCKTPFYHVNDARLGKAPVHIPAFKPSAIDPACINSFAQEQAILMEMMSRYTLGKQDGSFHQRRQYLWELYRIWEGLFDSLKPDVVISASMPHRIFDYLVYLICQKRSIPFIALECTSIPHLVYSSSSITDPPAPFDAKYFTGQSLPPLSPETLHYFENIKNPSPDYKPVYHSLKGLFSVHRNKKAQNPLRAFYEKLPQPLQILILFLKLLPSGALQKKLGTVFTFGPEDRFESNAAREGTVFQNLLLTLKTYFIVTKAEGWYKRNTVPLDTNKPYIYFPANFQPERSTVPDAGQYFDFPLLFSMLEKAIPQDWNIYYKEHPRSFRKPIDPDNPRDTDFFLRLQKACPRIQFIDIAESGVTLIQHAKAIATARGTTGWEALCRGKPVILFGDYWYGRCAGVAKINSLEDLKQAVSAIRKNPEIPESSLISYLQRVESISTDLTYYYKDNVEERARLTKNQPRTFTSEEQIFRADFSKKMGDYIAYALQKRCHPERSEGSLSVRESSALPQNDTTTKQAGGRISS